MVPLVFMLGRDIGISNTHYSGRAEHNSEQYAGHTKDRIERECVTSHPADMQKCVQEIVEASRESQRGEYDLSAQESMAKWTQWMFMASIGGLAISGLALLALLRSLNQTQTAIKDNRELGERELRAYVVVDDIRAENVERPAPADDDIRVRVDWKNAGQTPARRVRWDINHDVFDSVPVDFNFPPADAEGIQQSTLGPQQVTKDVSRLIIGVDANNAWYKGSVLLVWGWIEYFDAFQDTVRHRTEFCIALQVFFDADTGSRDFGVLTETSHNGNDGDCLKSPMTTV